MKYDGKFHNTYKEFLNISLLRYHVDVMIRFLFSIVFLLLSLQSYIFLVI